MGFILYLTRKLSDRLLLTLGLILALFSTGILEAVLQYRFDEPFPWWSTYDVGAARHFEVIQGSSYSAYLDELWWASWETMWGMPFYIKYCATALGRFMIGAWIFRQGWFQQIPNLGPEFRRCAMFLISGGVLCTLFGYWIGSFSDTLAYVFSPLTQLLLALGYGASIVVFCQNAAFRNAMQGVAAVGRTALTNYLLQSVMYLFVLYGFGLGLITLLGSTLCLAIALSFFALQIGLSRWWVKRFYFGPVEWLWRSLTYNQRQPFVIHEVRTSDSK